MHREELGWDVWSVRNPNELTQVAGWLRYTSSPGLALYRGQGAMHSTMLATGFRGTPDKTTGVVPHEGGLSDGQVGTRHNLLSNYVTELYGAACKCFVETKRYNQGHLCEERLGKRASDRALIAGTYRAVVEPLLQHYGIRTRWIDVVDNIWVALWFACHRQISKGRYAYHERRSPAQEGPNARAFVFVFETGALADTQVPGYQVGEHARMVDLRYSVPSMYLRPHAQHGALLAPAKLDATTDPIGSLKHRVAGVIDVALEDALDWLGTGGMTSSAVLFPSAARDEGYRRLLEWEKLPPRALGSLTVFGPGM